MRRWILVPAFVIAILTSAQDPYVAPSDPLVQKKLAWWQDQKFGLLMHWGTYSQWGIVESWSLCNEDEGWCARRGPFADDYYGYRSAYENLKTTFNPTAFDPTKWAAAAKNAGMGYVVFTTKHHDGFCMFDTKLTDYKITSNACPFQTNAKADVTKAIFDAFRAEGIGTGAYFSKPDWHCPDYWWPYFTTPDRNVNYDPKKYPERWQRYVDYTSGQIEELMSNYGPMDILWLDGGWVRPHQQHNPDWAKSPYDQDIDMPHIAAMARQHQPGLIVVDRSVGGEFENYQTPEGQVPGKLLPYPWETCMPMATSWSYVPNDTYKTSRELIRTLCTIVARGGNFLLNIAPGPNGDWDPIAYERLKDISAWMAVNGEAIHATRSVAPFESGAFFFTSNDRSVYALLPVNEDGGNVTEEMSFDFPQTLNGPVHLLGMKGCVRFEQRDDRVRLILTPTMLIYARKAEAIVFQFTR